MPREYPRKYADEARSGAASGRTAGESPFLLAILGREYLEQHIEHGLELTLRSPAAAERVAASQFLCEKTRAVHLPYTFRGTRLNIADTDADFRHRSIELIVETLKAAEPLKAVSRYVIHPLSLETWDGRPRGTYALAIDSFRELMKRAAGCLRGPMVLENNRVYFPASEGGERSNRIFADNPAEWRRLASDVGHHQLGLCLDTSHAVTSAQMLPKNKRRECLREFLAEGEKIIHVHWSGNYPDTRRGRQDSHEALGRKGTQPLWFHRAIARLDATKTVEIPRPEKVEESLAWLRRHKLI